MTMKSAKWDQRHVTCADGHLYFRYQNGMMKLVEANTRGYMEKGSFQIPNDRKNSWQHPVVAGRKALPPSSKHPLLLRHKK